MTERSAQKKELILQKAREVFAAKGFKSVTMQDIVDACEISRGGLYLYFGSTEELFLAVLDAEVDENDDAAVAHAILNDGTAGDMLALFLKEQKKAILRPEGSLVLAGYEYYSSHKSSEHPSPLKRRFLSQVQIIDSLVRSGVESGEFYCTDPEGFARNMMYVIEGLKCMSRTTGITQEIVDRELLYLLKSIIISDG